MAAKVIKSGEPFNFPAFNFGSMVDYEDLRTPPVPTHNSMPSPVMEKAEKVETVVSPEAEAPSDVDEILRAARAEAAKLIAEAQARAAELERAARERGRAEAQAKVQAEVNQAVENLRAKLTNTLDELDGLRPGMAARAEQDLVRLALEIAKKIVRREVKVDHEVALTLARVALGRLHSRTSAIVRLHPDDYAYVREHRQRLGTESTVEIIEDRSVGIGGCMVQSEMGEIDARIEQQFAEIEKDFL